MKAVIPAVMAATIALSAPSIGIARLSRADYYMAQERNAAAYKRETTSCGTMAAHAKEVCLAQARGRAMAARTELEAAYRPTTRNRYEALLAKAEGDYLVSVEKCNENTDSIRDACVREALATRIASKGDARAKMMAADAAESAEPRR